MSAMTEQAKPAAPPEAPMSEDEFVASVYRIGEEYYHDKHPLHRRMAEGRLTQREIQGWVANRYYYQTRIPIKDGLILSKADDREVRREWLHRITDHDGNEKDSGGIEKWLDLAEAVGLEREATRRHELLLPEARAAVDSYVDFVAGHPLFDCVAASLTELFATGIHKIRLDTWPEHYPWVDPEGLAYFRNRLTQAPPDARWGLDYVKAHATTAELQERARFAVIYKCGLLWDLATAIEEGFSPGRGDWRPRLARKAKLRWDEIDKTDVLLLPERGLKLNATASPILRLCDGIHLRREIVEAMQQRFPQANPREVKISTMIFLDQFEQQGILE